MKYKPFETMLDINWIDHQSWQGWTHKEDIDGKVNDECFKCRSIGFFVKETDLFLAICQVVTENQVSGLFQILKSDITNVKVLNNGR